MKYFLSFALAAAVNSVSLSEVDLTQYDPEIVIRFFDNFDYNGGLNNSEF